MTSGKNDTIAFDITATKYFKFTKHKIQPLIIGYMQHTMNEPISSE